MSSVQEELEYMRHYAEQKVVQNKEYEWKINKLTEENRELRKALEDKECLIEHQYEDNEALYEEIFELCLKNMNIETALKSCREALEDKSKDPHLGVFCHYCGTLASRPFDFCPNCGEEMDKYDWVDWDEYMRDLR